MRGGVTDDEAVLGGVHVGVVVEVDVGVAVDEGDAVLEGVGASTHRLFMSKLQRVMSAYPSGQAGVQGAQQS